LVARELESRGIPTVSLAALRKPAQLARAPRVLFTGNPNSEIVGPPNDKQAQLATLREALRVLVEAADPGIMRELP
jgi:hypothetical protein